MSQQKATHLDSGTDAFPGTAENKIWLKLSLHQQCLNGTRSMIVTALHYCAKEAQIGLLRSSKEMHVL